MFFYQPHLTNRNSRLITGKTKKAGNIILSSKNRTKKLNLAGGGCFLGICFGTFPEKHYKSLADFIKSTIRKELNLRAETDKQDAVLFKAIAKFISRFLKGLYKGLPSHIQKKIKTDELAYIDYIKEFITIILTRHSESSVNTFPKQYVKVTDQGKFYTSPSDSEITKDVYPIKLDIPEYTSGAIMTVLDKLLAIEASNINNFEKSRYTSDYPNDPAAKLLKSRDINRLIFGSDEYSRQTQNMVLFALPTESCVPENVNKCNEVILFKKKKSIDVTDKGLKASDYVIFGNKIRLMKYYYGKLGSVTDSNYKANKKALVNLLYNKTDISVFVSVGVNYLLYREFIKLNQEKVKWSLTVSNQQTQPRYDRYGRGGYASND